MEDETVIVTTDPEFRIDLFERRDPFNGDPLFGLWIRSTETFTCSNYVIESTVQTNGSEIKIHLSDVRKPDTCIGAPGPAQAFMPIGNLPAGTYTFSLSLGDAIENQGTLKVLDDGYQLSIEYPQGIDFQNIVLNKIQIN